MAKITRIKTSDSPRNNKPAKAKETEGKKVFILFRPFVALGRYLRDSWREIRQVRWPNRKATWKMVLAVFVYTALFVAIISLLDLFFTWLFSLIIK
ncbi:preprotein translocase subunit SecE [Candidatus Saccharibacteria bacterium]|nr:preprotein translocase subunit SecE [Candidatus Saccharibacteria bacterium]MBR0424208.1 preprotein translocase subunit SecE [Candidatus Saccharibacteria bacterium]